jgi:hypothetical protein
MSFVVKPRYGSKAGNSGAIMSSLSDDKDEKAEKISRAERQKVRFLLTVISFLTIVAFFLGQNRVSVSSKIPGKHSKTNSLGEVSHAAENAGISTDELVEKKLVRKVKALDFKVREHKALPNMIMETDPGGLKLTKELQDWTKKLLIHRYGDYNFRVKLDLTFPSSIPDYSLDKAKGSVVFEMASIDLIPCSVFMFMEVARTWKSGAFHRNAGHVLQVTVNSEVKKTMPFQEYSPKHPHAKFTTGYAGRPSGPAFYISIKDNSKNHGPGSQQHHNPHEADANFGRVVVGEEDIVPRIHSVPQHGWLSKENQIRIDKMTILYAKSTNNWVEWKKNTPSEIAQTTKKV